MSSILVHQGPCIMSALFACMLCQSVKQLAMHVLIAGQRKASGSGRSAGSGKSPKPSWLGFALSGVEDTIPEASTSPVATSSLPVSKPLLLAATAESGSNRSSRPPSIGAGSRLPSTQHPIPGLSNMGPPISMELAGALSSHPPKPSSPNFVNEVEAKLQEAEQLLQRQLRLRKPGSSTHSDRQLVMAPPSREVRIASSAGSIVALLRVACGQLESHAMPNL